MNQDQITAKMAEIQGESLNTAFALSTKAIELELSDMEGLEDPSVMEYLKKRFERDDK